MTMSFTVGSVVSQGSTYNPRLQGQRDIENEVDQSEVAHHHGALLFARFQVHQPPEMSGG